MIIYGYRNREIETGARDFYCPKCETQRPYKFKKIERYFTLFFIPLFPLGIDWIRKCTWSLSLPISRNSTW
jgi:hypothetical protein